MEIIVLFYSRHLLNELGIPIPVSMGLIIVFVLRRFVLNKKKFILNKIYSFYYFSVYLMFFIVGLQFDLETLGNLLVISIFPLIMYSKQDKISQFSIYFILFSALLYSIFVLNDFGFYVNRKNNYLLLERGLLFALAVLSSSYILPLNKHLRTCLIIIIVLTTMLMHGRLNFGLSVICLLYYTIKNYNWKFNLLAFLIIFVFLLQSILESTVILRLLNDPDSISNRALLIDTALTKIFNLEIFFGGGLNYSSKFSKELVGYPYVHNIIIEVLLDYGIFAFPLILLFTKTIFIGFVLLKRKDVSFLFLLFLMDLMQFLKSFEFNQSLSLFLLLSYIIYYSNDSKSKYNYPNNWRQNFTIKSN